MKENRIRTVQIKGDEGGYRGVKVQFYHTPDNYADGKWRYHYNVTPASLRRALRAMYWLMARKDA